MKHLIYLIFVLFSIFIFTQSIFAHAGEPTIYVDILPSVYSQEKEGLSIGGKRVDELHISKPVKLQANTDSEVFSIGAFIGKGQRALFEAELQIRNSWNNSNSFNCVVSNQLKGKSLFGMPLDAITYNDNGTNKTTGSALRTTGVYRWAVVPAPNEGTIALFSVVCRGWTYGTQPSLVLHLSRVTFE